VTGAPRPRHDPVVPDPVPLLVLALPVLVTRFPWMFAGPGLDADSFRVLEVAEIIQKTGRYEVSRFPGYPVYEYLVAMVYVPGQYGLTNAISAAATSLCLYFSP